MSAAAKIGGARPIAVILPSFKMLAGTRGAIAAINLSKGLHMSSMRRRIPAWGAFFTAVLVTFAFAGVAGAGAATLPDVTVAVTPTSATVGGALESGAVNIAVSDTGVKEANVVVFQIKPGVTLAEVEAFAKSKKAAHDPNTTVKYGSIVFDVEANPGKATEAATVLEAGEYVVLVGEGEKPVQLRTHFTVKASKAPAALPAPAATEKTIEFAFRGPTTLHDGELVLFENEGFLVHMDIAFPVKNVAAAKTAVKDLLSGNEKGLGKLIAGAPVAFSGPLSHGSSQEETVSAKPGIYVQACFMETQDGRDHTRLGMERVIKITK